MNSRLTRCELGEQLMCNDTKSNAQRKIIIKERGNLNGGHGDVIPKFLPKGSTSSLEGCGAT